MSIQSVNRLIEKSNNAHKGFTLIEMLVVIGIIAILVGVSLTSFSKMAKTADKTKAQELVSQTATALAAIYEADGMWPRLIREANQDEEKGMLGNAQGNEIARILANRGYMSMSMREGKLVGRDRFGILTPWAAKVVERKGQSAKLDDTVSGGKTVKDNILRFAVDLDGDGEITADECGNRIKEFKKGKETNLKVIRATVAVWCVSKDGEDQIQSWTKGQTLEVK